MVIRMLSSAFWILIATVTCSALFTVTKEEKSEGTNWAVLVAGSNGYINYRHQADICHAYQILHANGIPDKNIIVMMFDDIAYNDENPLRGTIINRPNGTDVYAGVVKDYTGEQVTAENFLNVILGNRTALEGIGSGKVLESGSNDRVFINMADHGAPGMFCFPDTYLTSTKLIDALLTLHHNMRFKEMVIYMESCESGSMFSDLLPHNIKVYAVTASSPTESSYATYYEQRVNAYVGDLFSVKWMEDVDSDDLNIETLDFQFNLVSEEVLTTETPFRYGQYEISYEKVLQFLGPANSTKDRKPVPKEIRNYLDNLKMQSMVESPDVPWVLLENKLGKTKDEEELATYKRKLVHLFKNRKFLENTVEEIVLRITWDRALTQEFMNMKVGKITKWECYEDAVASFHSYCFNLGKNPHALRFVGIFSKLCDHKYSAKEIKQSILQVCDFPPVVDIM